MCNFTDRLSAVYTVTSPRERLRIHGQLSPRDLNVIPCYKKEKKEERGGKFQEISDTFEKRAQNLRLKIPAQLI